jgi:propionyl-CoA carboxylase alpha chain
MIRLAAGEKLPMTQQDVMLKGWAMEARVCAEDPLRNFLPSIGFLEKYVEPPKGDDVRIDGGIREGDSIIINYDSMIAKLITYGKDRNETIRKMRDALDAYVIRGVNHNICFLRSVMDHPRYIKGDISTKFIAEEYPSGFTGYTLNQEGINELVTFAALNRFLEARVASTVTGALPSYHPPTSQTYVTSFNGTDYRVSIQQSDKPNECFVQLGNKPSMSVSFEWATDYPVIRATINNKRVTLQVIQKTPVGYKIQHYGTIVRESL